MGTEPSTRANRAVITVHLELVQVWPEVTQALRRYLRSRDASPQDAEDVLQECAVRVLRARPSFVDAADLVRWCIPVVRNLTIDLHRRDRRETSLEVVRDRPGRTDVAESVSHSLELGRVLHALQEMRESDRDVIVAHVQQEATTELDRKQAVRLNVQRYRARQRLLARLAAVLGIAVAYGRRAARFAAPAMLPAALALGLFAGDLGVLTGPPGSQGVGPTRSGEALSVDRAAVHPTSPSAGTATRWTTSGALGTRGDAPPASATHTVVAAAAPDGTTVRVFGHQTAPKQGALVCTHHIGLPDTCIVPSKPGGAGRG